MDYTFTSNTESLPIGKMYLELTLKGCEDSILYTTTFAKGFRFAKIGSLDIGVAGQIETEFQAAKMNFEVLFESYEDKNNVLKLFSTQEIDAVLSHAVSDDEILTVFYGKVDNLSITSSFRTPTLSFDVLEALAPIFTTSPKDHSFSEHLGSGGNYLASVTNIIEELIPGYTLDNKTKIQFKCYDLDTAVTENYQLFDLITETRGRAMVKYTAIFGAHSFYDTFGEALKSLLLNFLSQGFAFPYKIFKMLPLYYDGSPTYDISNCIVDEIKYNPTAPYWKYRGWRTGDSIVSPTYLIDSFEQNINGDSATDLFFLFSTYPHGYVDHIDGGTTVYDEAYYDWHADHPYDGGYFGTSNALWGQRTTSPTSIRRAINYYKTGIGVPYTYDYSDCFCFLNYNGTHKTNPQPLRLKGTSSHHHHHQLSTSRPGHRE